MFDGIDGAVAVLGGGTGTYAVIRALRRVIAEDGLTSIHTMSDSGGSSRRLMDEYGLPLPMGDLRQGLVAQSRTRRLWRDLFAYRFAPTEVPGVGGHSLGNLILHALEDLNGGQMLDALGDAEQILNTVGHVLPVTLQQATLCAELADGSIVRGEDRIDRPEPGARAPIRHVFLDPQPTVAPQARKALERAARIIIGPGDLYTSILPTLLVDGVCEAIADADAEVIYIVNLMTKPGETDGYTASDFVCAVKDYLGRPPDTVLVHAVGHRADRLQEYAEEGALPVEVDLGRLRQLSGRVISGDFATEQRLVRHDPNKLLAALYPPRGGVHAAPRQGPAPLRLDAAGGGGEGAVLAASR